MPASELLEETNPELGQRPRQIASWTHLVGFLLIGAGVVALGSLAQHAPAGGGGASPGQLASHSKAIPIYLTAILMDWALLYYCWGGVHHAGGNLKTLSGGRWSSWKSVAVDLGIALSVDSLLPQSLLEILVWMGASVTAGVCEEMAFRGYLQRQLQALSGSVVLAVLGQGLVFGLFHSYQGWKNVIVISVLGVLYGALAAWRRNLRINIATHAWTDVWEGWLKFVVKPERLWTF
jgi:membrane protease YdiL (CAAX protease family)